MDNQIAEPMHLNTRQLSHDSAQKVFMADASDLGIGPGHVIREFYVQSHKTNTWVAFVWNKTVRDSTLEDIVHWEFTPTTRTLEIAPDIKGYRLVIFND